MITGMEDNQMWEKFIEIEELLADAIKEEIDRKIKEEKRQQMIDELGDVANKASENYKEDENNNN